MRVRRKKILIFKNHQSCCCCYNYISQCMRVLKQQAHKRALTHPRANRHSNIIVNAVCSIVVRIEAQWGHKCIQKHMHFFITYMQIIKPIDSRRQLLWLQMTIIALLIVYGALIVRNSMLTVLSLTLTRETTQTPRCCNPL